MLDTYEEALMDFLLPMVNENRLALIEQVLSNRTRYVTVMLEDIYQPQNASAVLRTCDCFGIQDVHVVENRNSFNLNPEVELGAAQWLSVNKYSNKTNNTPAAIGRLREMGYRIVATTPHNEHLKLENFDLSKGKAAIMLGTEMQGLSENAMDMADEYLKIPMVGFTESFNISVSAAIILHHLNFNLRKSDIDWRLEDTEIKNIRLQWIRNSVKNINIIEKEFKKKFGF
ncbi:MAG: RNA methyltransferase [Bacteroidales bacterium]|nr:RNA methyltransferase [Bacteroidales bacterium]